MSFRLGIAALAVSQAMPEQGEAGFVHECLEFFASPADFRTVGAVETAIRLDKKERVDARGGGRFPTSAFPGSPAAAEG